MVSVAECKDGRRWISYSGNCTDRPWDIVMMTVSKLHSEGIVGMEDKRARMPRDFEVDLDSAHGPSRRYQG